MPRVYREASRGDPDRVRTCDPEIRNLVLYPAELLDHALGFNPRWCMCQWPAWQELFHAASSSALGVLALDPISLFELELDLLDDRRDDALIKLKGVG